MLYCLAIEIEFGVVYFTTTFFLFLYIVGFSERKKSKKSAYSVFNDNCERLQGTFTAEQFDAQLRHGRM